MNLSLLRRPRPATESSRHRLSHSARRRSFAVEGLESRLVLSAAAVAPPPLPPAHVAPPTPAAQAINILPLKVSSVSVANGGLVANVTLGHTTIPVALTVTTSPATPAASSAAPAAVGPTASILSLHLAPINLDLLGLDVTTSEICLNITAQKGGGLLGTLLFDIDHLLAGGSPLGSVLGSLSSGQLTKLTNGLTDLLNGALSTVTSSANISGVSTSADPSVPAGTPVLDLSLGPVNLNLLGLQVNLDNCAGGPIKVDITAIPTGLPGGGLLGDLLTSLDDALAGGAGTGLLSSLESAIAADIKSLI